MKLNRYGLMLPSGNDEDWWKIRQQLRRRGVIFKEHLGRWGHVLYFEKSELPKLPFDYQHGDRYIPLDVGNSQGFSIYRISSRWLQ